MKSTPHFLPASIVLLLSACTGDARTQSPTPDGSNTVTMKYTKVFHANEQGYAKVTAGEGATHAEGIIDAKGVEIIPPLTTILIDDITASTALVRNGREHLFVDLGNGPIDTKLFATTKGYQYAEPFRCGRAMVQVDDRWFYIDTVGTNTFGTDYDFAESFHADRAMVMQDGKYHIIDTNGKTVARMNYDQVNPYTEMRWQVTTIKGDVYWSGFVDLEGKEVVPLIYTEITMYQPEVKRSRAVIKEKIGYIDELGNVAVPIQYEYGEIFDKGKARVILNGREFFIDPDGKEVVE